MKKSYVAWLLGGISLLAACNKDVMIEEPLQTETPMRLEVNFVPSYGDAATKAVKQAWESGDKVFVFFEGVSEGYLILQYDGSDWTDNLMYITTTQLAASGKSLAAVYLPFDNDAMPSFVNGRWSFNKTSLSYYLASQRHGYTVDTEGDIATLSLADGNLLMTIPDGFVQFFINDTEAVNAGASLRVSDLVPTRFDGVSLDGVVSERSFPAGTALPGYAYGEAEQKGYLFSACLPADRIGVSSDYEFHYVKGLEMKGATATGKTLNGSGTIGRAVNITDLSWADESLTALPMWEDTEGYKYYFTSMNLGADAETDFGKYYAWGELEGYRPTGNTFSHSFGWPTYHWSNDDGSVFSKYNDKDGKTVLEAEDDAAAMWIGGGWHIPAKEEWKALLDNCDAVWHENYNESGVKGWLFTGRGPYVTSVFFLPAAGNVGGSELGSYNYYVYYWSSTCSDTFDTSYHLYNNGPAMFLLMDNLERYIGTPIRPILKIK